MTTDVMGELRSLVHSGNANLWDGVCFLLSDMDPDQVREVYLPWLTKNLPKGLYKTWNTDLLFSPLSTLVNSLVISRDNQDLITDGNYPRELDFLTFLNTDRTKNPWYKILFEAYKPGIKTKGLFWSYPAFENLSSLEGCFEAETFITPGPYGDGLTFDLCRELKDLFKFKRLVISPYELRDVAPTRLKDTLGDAIQFYEELASKLNIEVILSGVLHWNAPATNIPFFNAFSQKERNIKILFFNGYGPSAPDTPVYPKIKKTNSLYETTLPNDFGCKVAYFKTFDLYNCYGTPSAKQDLINEVEKFHEKLLNNLLF